VYVNAVWLSVQYSKEYMGWLAKNGGGCKWVGIGVRRVAF